MRTIYHIAQVISQIMLYVGIIAIVTGILMIRGQQTMYGAIVAGTGVSLFIASVILSLLTCIGEDVYALRCKISPEEDNTPK